jgi:NAD(P)-dependent dehydrogenase (short-subunit alcohol dehydrogenase family)
MEDEDMSATWFITGTSSGIGQILTRKLLERGDRVAATARRPEVLAGLKDEHGDRLWIAQLDVRDTVRVRETVDRAFGELGRIDVVVNNAGYGLFGAAEEATDEQVRDVIDTNLVGSIAVIRAALPHLRAQGGGHILQVSSEGGQLTYPAFSLYHAAKWGIEGFVEAMSSEVAPFGIRCTLIEPGPTETGFAAGMVRTTPNPAYDATSAGAIRRAVNEGSFTFIGDADKMADAMLAVVERDVPPLRLALGSTSYERIRQVLTDRRDALDAQKDIAFSTDRNA